MTWWPLAAAGGVLLLLFLPRRVQARGPGAGLVASGRISSSFGMRRGRMHNGIDIAAPEGTEIRAARAGVVADVSPDGMRRRYGNTVIVDHGDALTLYGHMSRFGPGIKLEREVQAGDVIGYVGSTQLPELPMVRKPHLHFEVLKTAIYTPKGRIIVHAGAPERYEPQAWLRKYGTPVAG